jgi:hypothetical protein
MAVDIVGQTFNANHLPDPRIDGQNNTSSITNATQLKLPLYEY